MAEEDEEDEDVKRFLWPSGDEDKTDGGRG